MFDFVNCEANLPVQRGSLIKNKHNPFQSKSVGLWLSKDFSDRAYDTGCVTLTITRDKKLLDPDGADLNWTGDLEFYGGKHLFVAKCLNGKVLVIAGG